MPTYTAEFRTDAGLALLQIRATTPQKALAKARKLDPDTIDFTPYGDLLPVNYIAIRDKASNDLAEWQSDALRLQKAALDMLEALELCEDVLSELARSDDGTPSVSALDISRAAIAKAKGGEVEGSATPTKAESKTINLPPDPEGKNADRAAWADEAIRCFQSTTGTDWEDAVADLLCDLMHLCDREAFKFEKELDRARMHYEAETTEGGAL